MPVARLELQVALRDKVSKPRTFTAFLSLFCELHGLICCYSSFVFVLGLATFHSQISSIMSSHVVVLDSQLRRATVKTTPNKPLSDVLSEACQKLSLNADSYGLKQAVSCD